MKNGRSRLATAGAGRRRIDRVVEERIDATLSNQAANVALGGAAHRIAKNMAFMRADRFEPLSQPQSDMLGISGGGQGLLKGARLGEPRPQSVEALDRILQHGLGRIEIVVELDHRPHRIDEKVFRLRLQAGLFGEEYPDRRPALESLDSGRFGGKSRKRNARNEYGENRRAQKLEHEGIVARRRRLRTDLWAYGAPDNGPMCIFP